MTISSSCWGNHIMTHLGFQLNEIECVNLFLNSSFGPEIIYILFSCILFGFVGENDVELKRKEGDFTFPSVPTDQTGE